MGFPDILSIYDGDTENDSCDDIPSSALVSLQHTRRLHFQWLPTYVWCTVYKSCSRQLRKKTHSVGAATWWSFLLVHMWSIHHYDI